MVLDFEYGINTGNRFLQFVDHDEEPEAFIAAQTQEEEKQRKSSTKDSKQTTTTKKVTSKTTTTTTKTNKENLTTKSTNVDSRRQQSATAPAVFGDNNNQPRGDSARGSRGGSRRGGPPFEGAGRGRSQRFNKFEGQGSSSNNESASFDQGGDAWSNEAGSRGGRGRGGPRRGNFEGGRGSFEGGRGTGGRGRGRGGRGNFNNRSQEEGSQQEGSGWQQSSESNFESGRSNSNRDYDQDASATDRSFEPDGTRRNNRGTYRGRGYHSNRTYSDRESGEAGQEEYRPNRRQYDRQPRSFVSSVKPIEKKDGEGAHNWGNPTENPEEHPISDEINETTVQSAPASKDWAQQVEEAEKQMTLDEYKKQMEAKKRANQEKLPQFKTRAAGEGEDPKSLQKLGHEYRKKNDDDEDEEEEEEGSDVEENESGEEEEHMSGKKKLITIPLRFKPIEMPRGSGGQRRGGNRFRPNRDEQQRSTSPNQGQQPSSQQYDDSYRGGQRGGRGDYRRPNRGYRQGRSNADPNAPSLDNPEEFPTLPKQ